MTRTRTKAILLAIDFGGSATKVFYQARFAPTSSVHLLTMPPEVAQVSAPAIAGATAHSLGSLQSSPEHRVWVGVPGEADYWAVGNFAQRFHAHAGLTQLKYERAVYKTLATLWIIEQQLALPATFRVSLACLLPAGEYEDRHRFQQKLTQALHQFETPTGLLHVQVDSFACAVEGSGVVLAHAQRSPNFSTTTTAVVMLGYRNASVLVFNQGNLVTARTCTLGFVQAVEHVLSHSSGQTHERLLAAIVQYLQSDSLAAFVPIVRARQEPDRTDEIKHLGAVTTQAIQDYSQTLLSWIDEVLPPGVDEVIFAGGSADLLRSHLLSHFRWQTCSFHAEVEVPQADIPISMKHRLVDVWMMFQAQKAALEATQKVG
ncbi:MAG: ParM/StbA family protein [Leptolyngbyaceae cyanobacterium bins.302]|nr:ParM/StbA family protein [Leptolyngbyaceae cyanobacterium bins.302]